MKKLICVFILLFRLHGGLVAYVDMEYDEDYFDEENCIEAGEIFCTSSFDREVLDVIVAGIIQDVVMKCKNKEFDKAIIEAEKALRVAELLKDKDIRQVNIDSAAYHTARAYYKKFDSMPRYGCPFDQCSDIDNKYYLEHSISFLEKISANYKERDIRAELNFAYDEILKEFQRDYDKRTDIYLQRAKSSSGIEQYEHAAEAIINLEKSNQTALDKWFDAYSLQLKFLLVESFPEALNSVEKIIEISTLDIENNLSTDSLDQQMTSYINLGKLYLLKTLLGDKDSLEYIKYFNDAKALITKKHKPHSEQYDLFHKKFIRILTKDIDFFSTDNEITEQFSQSIYDYLSEECKPGSYDDDLQICLIPPKKIAPPRNLKVRKFENKSARLIECIAEITWNHDTSATDVIKYNYCAASKTAPGWEMGDLKKEFLVYTNVNYKHAERRIGCDHPYKFRVCAVEDVDIKDCTSGQCEDVTIQ